MELSFRMSRKDIRDYLRQQAKELNKKALGNKHYVVKSTALLYYSNKGSKPTVVYDHQAEKRRFLNG